jgi:lipoprotein-releasing system ATP-binding protein
LLEVQNVSKEYTTPRGPVRVLSGVNLRLERGQAAAIMGPSGTGKSSLLYVLGALEAPTTGSLTLDGSNPFALKEREQAAFRNQHIGFVFQDHCLLPQCSALENVLAPTLVARRNCEYLTRAHKLLEEVGLADRMDHRPAELSGGEKQRVALARALICQPSLLLADEPTGNLDRASAETVTSLLLDLHHEWNTILIVVTHSAELAAKFALRFELSDGTLRSA